jgi:hypothetical protein
VILWGFWSKTPKYFSIENTLAADAPWPKRLRAIRANASAKRHAELDEATKLDAGSLDELSRSYADLKACLPSSIFSVDVAAPTIDMWPPSAGQ